MTRRRTGVAAPVLVAVSLIAAGLAVADPGRAHADAPDTPTAPIEDGRIAFRHIVGGYAKIFVTNFWGLGLGSETTRVTDGVWDDRPDLSPNGFEIAFERRTGTDYDIWVMDWDGGDARNITNTPGTGDYMPKWSPSGQRIAFNRGGSDIWTMAADGTGAVNITADQDGSALDHTWSPDGTRIAYISFNDIWTMAANGTGKVKISSLPGVIESDPSWGPTGRIAFSATTDHIEHEIYTMAADGTDIRNVTQHPAADFAPDWSPSGDAIAFQSGRACGNARAWMYMIRPDGTGARPIAEGHTPSWSRAAPESVLSLGHASSDMGAEATAAHAETPAADPSCLELVGMEVTQGTQDLRQSVPLVADRPTWLRLHVRGPKNNKVVSATLTATRDGVALAAVSRLVNTTTAAPEGLAKRKVLQSSVNFELPPQWLTGRVTITAKSKYEPFVCMEAAEAGGIAHDCKVTADFGTPKARPKLDAVPIRFVADAAKPAGAKTPTYPMLVEEEFRLLETLPLGSLDFNLVAERTFTGALSLSDMLQNLGPKRAAEVCTGPCPPWVAFVHPDAAIGGTAVGIASDTTNVAVVQIGAGGAANFDRARYVTPHEVGHVLGMRHPGPVTDDDPAGRRGYCNEKRPREFPNTHTVGNPPARKPALGPMKLGPDNLVYGLMGLSTEVPATGAVVDPYQSFELLSYCSGLTAGRTFTWPSITTVRQAKTALERDFPVPVVKSQEEAAVATSYLVISGVITGAATVKLAPFFRVTKTVVPTPYPTGPYTVRVRDAAGAIVRDVSLRPDQDEGPASFTVEVADSGRAAKVQILKSGTVIATRAASGSPPAVRIVSPNGGAVPSGPFDITWTATDPNGGPLTSFVQYSPDAGRTWTSISPDLTTKTFRISTTQLRGTTQGRFRVVTSDGFRSAMDASDANVTVPNSPPRAAILTPDPGQTFKSTDVVKLRAVAHDNEADLPPSAYAWSSSISGALGTGPTLLRRLAAGSHVLTVKVTDAGGRAAAAKVSITVTAPPSAGRIVFSSDRDGQQDIYSAKPDGTDVKRLTTASAPDFEPDLSKDGKTIAWGTYSGTSLVIWKMNADGTGKVQLTPAGESSATPEISPDGTKIAYSGGAPKRAIWVMDADGSNRHPVTTNAGWTDSQPTWSLDGTKIAFTSFRDSGDLEVYVMNADGTGQTRLTTSAGDDWMPSWSYGTKILFTSTRSGTEEIWSVPAAGGAATRVTTLASSIARNPAWSPDLTKVVLVSNKDGNEDVWTISANGTSPLRRTTTPGYERETDWGG